jgi:hypothetical protein
MIMIHSKPQTVTQALYIYVTASTTLVKWTKLSLSKLNKCKWDREADCLIIIIVHDVDDDNSLFVFVQLVILHTRQQLLSLLPNPLNPPDKQLLLTSKKEKDKSCI